MTAVRLLGPLDILRRALALRFPPTEFAVFGSGPLGVRGIRQVRDLDVIVTPELWAKLAPRYTVAVNSRGVEFLRFGEVEVLRAWSPQVGAVDELIAEADVIGGVRFVRLEKVLEWKKLSGRQKDREDVALIHAYLLRRRLVGEP